MQDRPTKTTMYFDGATRQAIAQIIKLSLGVKSQVGVVRSMAQRYIRLLQWQTEAEQQGGRLVVTEERNGRHVRVEHMDLRL